MTRNDYIHSSEFFYGSRISDYGIKNGYVDYGTLSRAFDAVLNNEVMEKTIEIGYWEIENGSVFYYENSRGDTISETDYYDLSPEDQEDYFEHYNEVFQYYIIDENGARILEELTNEIVWYNEVLNMYMWGVTHYGTSWDYVLTDIKLDLDEMH